MGNRYSFQKLREDCEMNNVPNTQQETREDSTTDTFIGYFPPMTNNSIPLLVQSTCRAVQLDRLVVEEEKSTQTRKAELRLQARRVQDIITGQISTFDLMEMLVDAVERDLENKKQEKKQEERNTRKMERISQLGASLYASFDQMEETVERVPQDVPNESE